MAPVQVGYLGPPGTFSGQALNETLIADRFQAISFESVRAAVMAVQEQTVSYALVPIENSIQGPITATLDTLAGDANAVRIVGELVLAIHHNLIAASELDLSAIQSVSSHPQAIGQCSQFLRSVLPGAKINAAASTAEAVRRLKESGAVPAAAIGTALAAELYGCVVIAPNIEDRADNVTRFVWLARAGAEAGELPLSGAPRSDDAHKTSIVFWGPGAERPGWLVSCLKELANRGINLTKIESRPRRRQLGQYMFFADLQGAIGESQMDDALEALHKHCQQVRVLGSYRACD